ncbi:MAG: SpoIIE family protein phosphatase [Bryobacteraceae bacterium]|nr:SpoIIE family protein phosphatase [Bryobacteraceae bacterium]
MNTVREQWRRAYDWLGFAGTAFLASVLLAAVSTQLWPGNDWSGVFGFLATIFGVWLAVRILRIFARRAIWRLRNRLIVTYLFMALVPILLILALVGLAAWALTSQMAVHMVRTELDRRIRTLATASSSIEQSTPADRPDTMRAVGRLFAQRYPGLQILMNESGQLHRYPSDGTLALPPPEWTPMSGVVLKDGQYFAVTHAETRSGDLTILAPLTADYLADLVPNLGIVYFQEFQETGDQTVRTGGRRPGLVIRGDTGAKPRPVTPVTAAEQRKDRLPAAANLLDIDLPWVANIPVARWEAPSEEKGAFFLVVRTRPSAVLNSLFSGQVDWTQGVLPVILLAVAVVFMIVEIISFVIGVSMTRTITGAVHHLYDGTQKVMEGNFAHRIEVKGNDQLAELSHSFNRMTENLERLLVVAKEKERLQSEIEIAREVQNQLYPKTVPSLRTLKLTAVCQPARMVSGDYYDYECLRDDKIALAIGDVAGKGISAALLMATLQSSLRAQLMSSMEMAVVAGGPVTRECFSTSDLVSKLNQQLYANTSPEKYATFCLGLYNEEDGCLTYTNAGHLPPILVRDGVATRFEVNGTVVGAFPFALYEESKVMMRRGDLLVFFTDGVTEPENEYGEMFGEERLVDLVLKNSHRSDGEIVDTVIGSVQQWTGSPELQDDMTIMLARKL